MKILFVIDSLRFGGAQRQLVELIKGLHYRRHDVHLVSLKKDKEGYAEILTALGIELFYYYRTFNYDLKPVFIISQHIKNNQIDLVHSFMTVGGLMGMLAAKLTERPIVCSALRDAKDSDFMMKIEHKILARFTNTFVANSRAGFTNRFKRMKPHFRVVYNGVDFSRFEAETDILKLKYELGLSDFKYVIGMVASLSERKDHETLLDAAPLVIQVFPDTCFLLVGDGLNREYLVNKAIKQGLEKNIIFLGYRSDVDQIIRLPDVSVLLSNSDVHLEGISNAIMESMAVGVPVIASEGGGTDEIVINDINGILVPAKNSQKTADAIIELLRDKNKAEKLANKAKITARRMFNLKRYVDDYENIYRELKIEEEYLSCNDSGSY